MKLSRHAVVAVVVLAIVAMVLPLSAFARTKIEYFFPTMVEGPLAREMTKIVNEYNKMQDQVKVIAAYTGTYDETKIKAQAAFEAGKPPAVVLMSPFSIFDFVLSDYLEPLNPLIKADGMD
ncbi:MAG: extracellular solute-binding protein, partial [Deltaproteobacteria bacterium]|nr:extracellular solute-binding protein [Deltaproteobacteria bacterium]